MANDNQTPAPAERLAKVRRRIDAACQQAGRDPAGVTLVAVGKTKPAADIAALAGAGQADFAENYVQEATQKVLELRGRGLTWHFIGHIQSNKCAELAKHVDWIHSVDRIRVARRLDAAAAQLGRPLNIMVQVNVDEEAGKSGVVAGDLPALVEEISSMPALNLRGLMAIPRPADEFDAQRRPFAALRRLMDDLRAGGIDMDCLSMGMSADIEAAIHEGATHVRVGTALFGPRRY